MPGKSLELPGLFTFCRAKVLRTRETSSAADAFGRRTFRQPSTICAKLGILVKEIESFVEAIEPETCASEWMVQSGAVAPSRFRQAVSDMDAIRTDAWLLACQLAEADGQSVLASLPWSQWN